MGIAVWKKTVQRQDELCPHELHFERYPQITGEQTPGSRSWMYEFLERGESANDGASRIHDTNLFEDSVHLTLLFVYSSLNVT